MKIGDKHWSLADAALRSVARLAIGVLVARMAGAGEYADLVLLLVAEVVVQAALQAYYVTPLLSLAPAFPADDARALAGTVRRALRWFAIACTGAIGVLGSLAAGDTLTLGGWAAFGATVGFGSLHAGLRAAAQAGFRSSRAFAADLVAFGPPLVACALGGGVLDWLFTGWAAGQVAACALLGGFGRIASEAPISAASRARFVAFARPSAVGSLGYSATMRGHPYLLGALGSVQGVAQFGAASSIAGPLRLLSMALTGIVRPRLALASKLEDSALRSRVVRRALALQLGVGVALLGAVLGPGERLVVTVFGPGFAGMGALLSLTVVLATLEGLGSIRTACVQIERIDGARRATRCRLLAGGLGLLLAVPAIALHGALGAALALIAAEALFLLGLGGERCRVSNRRRADRPRLAGV